MTTLSSAGWVVHEVGLATSIGGTLFGRAALEPSLSEITSSEERDRVSASAWQRFSWLNLASHAAFAIPWFIGRSMLSGNEVTCEARRLTLVKDVLVGASLITGVSSILLGRWLGKRADAGQGPAEARDRMSPEGEAEGEAAKTQKLQRAVGLLGNANIAANIGVLGVTTLLAMQGNKSQRFSFFSRFLP
ncbi:MAG TPA: hypothetical protein VMZ53_00555 [Kofleriaceae bacterium]|nr:hypothetical protein [Kofleriaceae bacterium]